ncbi:zinc finger CCCH domain-containing protein 37 isoform X1 [Malus sylvestris]|uniref:zinc finger CCCH domain-containing protein 37 isoform X1 n=1 Tax=Malus sylvestris TaxID=3752 RepID=UPI0021AC04E3|nr:zinc finger CCCH domain-containing protein 37 isoform X1 [Malus sylvestris]
MSSHLYGFGAAAQSATSAATAAALSSVYSSRALTDSYLSDPALRYYSGSDPFADHHTRASSMYLPPHLIPHSAWPAPDVEPGVPGVKRPSEALYHQSYMGAYNTIGQEAWYAALAKRPRYEGASTLPIYPQRPGEKDCAHYMLTRTCKFGESCKFDHPIWVPEGGIPDWKEVPLVAPTEVLPERPGAPDCPYFIKTQRCKFGMRCKFNHPKDKVIASDASENADVFTLPERPSEPPCAFYLKTGQCKFGVTCKFHHPKDIQIPLANQENKAGETGTAIKTDGTGFSVKAPISFTPALLYNTKELPVRPGEPDCPFYLKTGSCKYGATCRYNHPDRYAINPPIAAISHPIVATPAAGLNIGVIDPAASIYQTVAQPTVGVGPTVYPQRFGQIECDYYMKTGECKFGELCKFHHPIDRSAVALSAPKAVPVQDANVKLTLAGLPRREGVVICVYYLKTGTCKYGASCKFDHPPPVEVMGMGATQGTSGGEAKSGEFPQEQQ